VLVTVLKPIFFPKQRNIKWRFNDPAGNLNVLVV
jgi:hypothetical protein